jgi:hypothetical protein
LTVYSIIELDVKDFEHGSQTGDSAFQDYLIAIVIQVSAVQLNFLNLGFSTIYGNLCGKRENWQTKLKKLMAQCRCDLFANAAVYYVYKYRV